MRFLTLEAVHEEVVLGDGDVVLEVEDGVGQPVRDVHGLPRGLHELPDLAAVELHEERS